MTPKSRLILYSVLAIAAGALLYFAIRQFGLLGTLLVPAAAAGAVLNQIAKTAGAKSVPKNDSGRPRRPGTSAVSPTPEEGEKRARPRRNSWR